MASVAKDGKGWRILFVAPDGKRKTLRLGRVGKKTAESIRIHVEALVVARTAGLPVRQETAVWLASVGDTLRERLVRAGLTEVTPVAVLGTAVEAYLNRQTQIKPASLCATRYALKNLVQYFGPERRLDSFTEGDADDFVRWLTKEACKQRGGSARLRPATVVKRVERVQAFFRDALRRELVSKNPFETVKRPKIDDSDRQVYVPAEVVERLIDATPDLEWKLLLAIARYLGLRVPSEPFSLTWADVDWEQSRLRVPSPKTEVHGKPYGVVPIVPPVRPHLEAVWEAAEPGQEFIFHRLRQRESVNAATRGWWANVNLRQHLLRLITRIGEQPWPRLWHSLRASAETDLVARFPLHVVTAWMGNTSKVATKHYLRVTPQDYTRAITEAWNGGTESGTLVAQNAAQQATAIGGKMKNLSPQVPINSDVMQPLARRNSLLQHKEIAGFALQSSSLRTAVIDANS